MSESVFQALRSAGFNPIPVPLRRGEAELRINDPDDLAQVHDIVDGFMAEVIQYAGSNRIIVREADPILSWPAIPPKPATGER